ncbi:MAG: hypothetical protein JXR10_04505 [Cyclobacteriaceae bacterium]
MKNLKSIACTLLMLFATSLIMVSCADEGMEDLKVETISAPMDETGNSGEGGGTNKPPGAPCEGPDCNHTS